MPFVAGCFLFIHVYAFLLFLVAFSFHLYANAVQRSVLEPTRQSLAAAVPRQLIERLDEYASAVHVLHPEVRKRRLPLTAAEPDVKQLRFAYGVSSVPSERAQALGFQRKLLGYKRKEVVYVPEISPDSRNCDLWNARQDVSFLVRCKVADGETACFRCIESRQYVRQCVSFERPLRVVLSVGSLSSGEFHSSRSAYGTLSLEPHDTDFFVEIPANESADEGYCLPTAFKQLVYDKHNGTWRPSDPTRNCNPFTGDWLLARLGTGDTSYNWICHCRYPGLMTNITTLLSDCMRPVGCKPYGELDEQTRLGLRNPYTDGHCVCDRRHQSARDDEIGPTCVPRKIITDTVYPQDLYRDYGLSTAHVLRWPDDSSYLDPRVSSLASASSSRSLEFPNPCRYDARTAEEIPWQYSCNLFHEQINGKWVAYCVSTHPRGVAVRSERDYLVNNNGRYANGCLLLDEGAVETSDRRRTDTRNSILSYQTNRNSAESRPDFGWLYAKSEVLRAIVDSVRNKRTWIDFMELVSPSEYQVGSNRIIKGTNLTVWRGKTDDWFVAYEQTPIDSQSWAGGYKGNLLKKWTSVSEAKQGTIYNLHDRGNFYYCISNPLGENHWNHRPRSSLQSAIAWIFPNRVSEMYINDSAFIYRRDQLRHQNMRIVKNNATRVCVSDYPVYYPAPKMLVPFWSGDDRNDEQFALYDYPRLHPMYRVSDQPRPKELKLDMPFVFNTNSDLFDSTLTVHENPNDEQEVYTMAERVCGSYRNHPDVMRNKLQGQWI